MADLLGLLGLGAAGLSAQHTGVAVASNNAANVNTEGYSRQRVDLRSQLGVPLVGGVRAGSPARLEDQLLAGRERDVAGAGGRSGALQPALEDLEARLATGGSIDGDLAALWHGLERVAAMPADSLVRQAAIAAARDLAAGFRRRAAEVAEARTEADRRVRDRAEQATALAQQIADTNQAIGTSSDPVLRDRRDQAAKQLAELVGGQGRIDGDGQLRWVLPDGAVLVDGTRAAKVETTPDPATGYRKVEIVDGNNRRDVTASLTEGRIGGDLQFRDGDAAEVADDLDQLAYDVATGLNAAHRAGAGLDGVTGRDLFGAPAAVAGAAAGLALDAAIDADPDVLAAGTAGAGPGDSRGALALLGVRDQRLAAGGTATLGDEAIDLAARLGSRIGVVEGEATRDADLSTHLAGLRDSLSGVDLDEELSSLVHFQHASEAMTRFVSTVDNLLSDLLNRL